MGGRTSKQGQDTVSTVRALVRVSRHIRVTEPREKDACTSVDSPQHIATTSGMEWHRSVLGDGDRRP